MVSPNVANKPSTKKAQEKKGADLAPELSKRKSQDFKSKIAGWNNTAPADEVQRDDEIVVVVETPDASEKKGGKTNGIKNSARKNTPNGAVDMTATTEAVVVETPKTPPADLTDADKTPGSRKPPRQIDSERKAWVRRRPKPQEKPSPEAKVEVKQAITPKKRVVSDGHWRRDRILPTKDVSTPEKDNEKENDRDITPKPITVRRSVVTIGLKTSPTPRRDDLDSEPVRVKPLTRRSRSRSPPAMRSGTVGSPAYESSGMKVYIKKNDRSKPIDRLAKTGRDGSASESSFAATSYGRPSTAATELTAPDTPPFKGTHVRRPYTDPKRPSSGGLLPRDRDSSRKTSAETKDSLQSDPIRTPRGERTKTRASPPSRNSLEEREPPRPVPRIYGNRIQGWLAGMPEDPFTDKSGSLPPLDSKDVSRKKQPRSVRDRVEEIESSSGGRRRSSGRRRRSRQSLEALDLSEQPRRTRSPEGDSVDITPAQTSALKRRGARRSTYSPVKERWPSSALPRLPESDSKRHVSNSAHHRIPSTKTSDIVLADPLRSRPAIHRGYAGAMDLLEGSLLSRVSEGDEPLARATTLKRRLTKHTDLMSVLSLPREDESSDHLARTKSRKIKTAAPTVGELMNEVTTDELKYQRELRTLVDGVIPVLLNYILKSESTPTTGSKPAASVQHDPSATKPIVDMGVALERLKSLHKRIPMHNPVELLRWAEGALKVYDDYLQVWRLGFHDIVVNLAPAEESSRTANWDQGLERNPDGDLTNGDGERVDVAYLLKRPLVRLKNFKKTFIGINQVTPTAQAKDIEHRYTELVTRARGRANDERARLEDEAASAIDPTRARDLQTLAPLSGVIIDATRSVRARDYFDMQLYHSSGQQLDCKIEVILRDDAPGRGSSGDVLFCEIAPTGRWLLFAPVLVRLVSARKSDKEGEIVVMVRGILSSGNEWREIMCLSGSDEQCDEWLNLFGSDPMPPRLTRQSSFNALKSQREAYIGPAASDLTEDVHVPIGERAKFPARRWDGSEVNSDISELPRRSIRARANSARHRGHESSPLTDDIDVRRDSSRYETESNPRDYYDDRKWSGRRMPRSAGLSRTRSKSEYSLSSAATSSRNDYSVWLPASDRGESDESSADEDDRPTPRRPSLRRRTSSVPSQDLPTVTKVRKASEAQTPLRSPRRVGFEEPTSAPATLTRPSPLRVDSDIVESIPLAPTTSQNKQVLQGLTGSIPSMTPAFQKKHRRSSSPLKHEYEPSTATDSTSESYSSDSDSDDSITSKSSNEAGHDDVSTLGELQDIGKFGTVRVSRQRPQSARTTTSIEDDGLRPSDSASQAAFPLEAPAVNPALAKTVACIFCWSDSGAWDSLHPQECEIVVTPGLIEAFDLAQAHQVSPNSGDPTEPSPSQRGVKPLVALELTPLVPLRRGTALDISIRSPPTSNSLLRTGNNIMFRSRSPEECEKLYGYINRARIDNPTWIALQNARGPVPTSNWAEVMDRRNAARVTSGSWLKSFSRKSSTYRSSGPRAVSTAATESSVGTMNSAFSALRRFSGSNRFFNIAKSTIFSKEGTRSTGSDSLDSGVATPVTLDASMGTPVGITNAKIRLWFRESASKWRDLGTGRLTVLIPPRPDPSDHSYGANVGIEKRVLVTGKTKGDVRLDVTLPEGSFERVARTGIAVSIWEDSAQARATGGVLTTSSKVFMLQMKSEREAAYTFSMVGKLRY